MNRIPVRTAAAAAAAGLAVLTVGLTGGAASAAQSKPVKPVTTCSDWKGVGDSTVSTRTCVTVKAGSKVSQARGTVQVKNTGTVDARVGATWTLTVAADGKKPAKVKTVTVARTVPANDRVYKLGGSGKYQKLTADALAEVQAKIVVKAADSGTDSTEDETEADT